MDLGSGEALAWEYTSGGGNISNDRLQELIAAHHISAIGGDTALLAQSTSWLSLPLRTANEFTSADHLWNVGVSGRVLKLSHVPTTRVIGELDQKSAVTDLLFLPENAPRWLVSAGDDGLLRLWPLTAKDLIVEACARLRNIVTPQAWTTLADSNQTSSCDPE